MKCDIIIKDGHVIDPASHVNKCGDIFVKDGKVISTPEGEKPEAQQIINAGGCLVFPGLIDFHAHIYEGATELGVPADVAFLPIGVTTAVDAGSAGIINYPLLSSYIIPKNIVCIKTLLNLSPNGLTGITKYHENIDPKHFNFEEIAHFFLKYRGEIFGLKIRLSKEIIGEFGMEPLKAAVEIAEKLSCPLVVHTTNPPVDMGEIAKMLRSGDVFCHVYHGTGKTSIGEDGCVLPELKRARERGVLFDASNGKLNFSLKIAQASLKDRFLPDIISTDITMTTFYREPIMGLPYVMSKFINMGMGIYDVVAACTSTPAHILGMDGLIGTLKPGANADVAIFRLIDHKAEFMDIFDNKLIGSTLLLPQMTICNGKVVYRQMNF